MSHSKRLLGILMVGAFLLCSCNKNEPSEPVDPTPVDPGDPEPGEPDNPENPDDPTPVDPEPTVYEKDDDGFYILENDYFSYSDDIEDTKTKNEVIIPPLEEGVTKYTQLKMFIGDRQVPIYNVKTNMSQTWTAEANSRMNNSYATFGLKGKVTVKLQANFNFMDQVTIRPSDRQVPFSIDANRRVLSFEIRDTGQYTIEMRSGRTLHLFVEDPSIMSNNDSDVMYFGPGIHKYGNDNRIGSNNVINLSSNQKVYLAPGSFVFGKFYAYSASNIQISGPGYIDGSMFERNPNNGSVTVPIDINTCNNITIKDIACVDPAGWCYNLYFCNGVTIDNVKIISSRSNGDGISVQSCQNVTVTNSFLRTWDDSLVVKNYPRWENRNNEGTTKHIHFSNCLIWTDLAQSMEIGYETVGQVLEDITFDNITVLHNYHKAIISIHNANNANVKDIHFTNITIEDAAMGKGDGIKYIVDIRNLFNATWSTNHKITTLGSIDGVEIDNVKVISGIDNPIFIIQGTVETRIDFAKTQHIVSNVSINDFYLYDRVVSKDTCNYQTNEYTNNITFSSSGNPVTGASYTPKDVSEYGNNINFIS